MKGTRRGGRDTNETIQSKRIQKVRLMVMLQSNKEEN